jgi:RNA polymerase sigma factor (sigma-70 family)
MASLPASMEARSSLESPGAVLEGNLEWIRALARSLARDESLAEDLAQEACVAALESPPASVARPRPWLATIVRNLWRARGRSEARRRAREHDAVRGDRTSEDLVEQVQVFREIAESVLELREPYRSAVIMRFWESLPPRAIASRLGTTPATVQNRIARGLAILRERLDRKRGGRQAWLSALVPWIDPPSAQVAISVGGLLVNAKLVVAALSVVLAAGIFVVWRQIDGRASPGAAVPGTAGAAASTGGAAELGAPAESALGAPAPADPRRSLSAAEAASAAAPAAPAVAPHVVRGRVLDVAGFPLGGIALGADAKGPPLSTSGADGRFELSTSASSLRLSSADPAWTTVRAAAWRPDTKTEPFVVVARSLDVEGRVEEVGGQPLSSARIRFALPEGFEARFDRPLEGSVSLAWSAVSDADGRFVLRGMPALPGARLRAVLEGFSAGEIAAPAGPADPATIVLARPEKPASGRVAGRVVDDRGNPVPLARVFLGLASVPTDARGEFAIDVARAVSTDRIVAVKAGWRPGVIERTRQPRGEDTGWPRIVEIVLPGPVLELRGRVVDPKGEPVPGLRVSIADPTPIGAIGRMPVHAEFLASGDPIPPLALESESRMPSEDGDRFNDAYMGVGGPSAFFHYAVTGADGSFVVRGLDDKRYRLRLQDPATCAYETTDELRAGAGPAHVVWQPPPIWDRVSGTVVDDEDRPVAGAIVLLEREAFGVRSRVFGGRVYVSLRDPREQIATDASGRFEFRRVPAEGMDVQVRGESVVFAEFLLSKSGAPDAVKLAVHQRCKFEVVIETPGLVGDEIALKDGGGNEVDILKVDSENVNAYTTADLTDGRSGVVSASSAARVLQLLSAGAVVKSVPLRLQAGTVLRVVL